jgi:competence protein ComGC
MKAVLKVIQVIQLLLSRKYKNERGMTLVEVLIVLLFISLIVGLVSTIYLSASKTSNDVINIAKSEIDSRLAIYRISRDIREATSIISAEDDRVSFISNVDPDDSYEEVSYSLESDNGYYNLVRSVDGGVEGTIITHLIDSDIFMYYSEIQIPEDGLSTPVTAGELGDIKLIKINVSIDQSGSQSLRTMDLDTIIVLRNKI